MPFGETRSQYSISYLSLGEFEKVQSPIWSTGIKNHDDGDDDGDDCDS